MQFNCEIILSTFAEECGKKVILVMKFGNKKSIISYLQSPLRGKILEVPNFRKKDQKDIENRISGGKPQVWHHWLNCALGATG